MNNRKNVFSAIVYQIVHIAYGLIIPRLILGAFGSEINGLVSSISQFLSFIALLEGGLGAVVLAELYLPIEERDHNKIKGILFSCQSFFRKLAIIYVAYTLVLAIVYSISVRDQYDFVFVSTLILILSLATLSQYLFSITLKLYLQADQRIYITNHITSATLFVNIIFALIVIEVFPEIRILKLASSIAFFVQPLVYRKFIPKDYVDYKMNKNIGIVLANRWSGFAQNLAHYINMNTDIVLITIFCSLSDVSVYTIYMLGINAIRSIVSYVTNSYQSALGKYIAQKDHEKLENHFKSFCIMTWGICIMLYCTCLLIVNPFVSVYTNNVNDANYYQPIFALIIVLANLVYCLREPFRLIVLAGGKFKETNFGSVMEAVLNLGISLALIKPFGLIGVAVGTLFAISYRLVYFIVFLKKDTLKLKLRGYLKYAITGMTIILFNIAVYFAFHISIDSMFGFFVLGACVICFELIVVSLLFFGIKDSLRIVKLILKH